MVSMLAMVSVAPLENVSTMTSHEMLMHELYSSRSRMANAKHDRYFPRYRWHL